MSSKNNAFDWRHAPSETGKSFGRAQTAPKHSPTPITISKKSARNSEASKIGSKSRNPTGNISTKRVRVG